MFLTPLARLRLAGRLCRVGAWLILVAGLAVSIVLFFIIYNPNSGNFVLPQLLQALVLSGLIAILVFFFFIFLFAVGALFEYIGATFVDTKRSSSEMSDDYAEITPLPL